MFKKLFCQTICSFDYVTRGRKADLYFKMAAIRSVSYTHLDVYKRQQKA